MAVGSGYISFTSGSFVNGNRTAIREKCCYTDSYSDMGQTQVTCIGETILLTSSSSACSCEDNTCGVFWLYQ